MEMPGKGEEERPIAKKGNCSNCAVCDEFIYRTKVHYGGKVLNLFTVQIMILIGVIVLWNYQI